MIGEAIRLTTNQLDDRRFRRVLVLSILLALVVLVVCVLVMRFFWPEQFATGWDWLDEFLVGWGAFSILAVIATYFLFPPVAMVFMGLMLDDVILAVEEKHYPQSGVTRKVSFAENAAMALKQAIVVLVINTLFLIVYIPLFFMSFGTLAAGLYVIVNGYLLGREYFDMVAIRFMGRGSVRQLRRSHSNKAFSAGVVIAGLFLVPFANLAAPLIGAALMTHMVHGAMREG